MTRRGRSLAVGLLVAGVSLLLALGAGAAPSDHSIDAPIRLRAASFHPQRGESPAIPPGLEAAPVPPGVEGYYLVQFSGPVRTEWRHGLEAAGATALGYVPDFAFKVRMTPSVSAVVSVLPGVAWVGPFHPAYKLAPGTLGSGPGLFRVRIENGAGIAPAVTALRDTGAVITRAEGRTLLVAASSAQLPAMARVRDVAWIEPFRMPVTHNEQGGGVIMGGSVALGRGYDGSTQVVAVADTGLGDGTAAGAHPDIPASRVTAIYDWTWPDDPPCFDIAPDGPVDVDSGHGTHTAVSAVGDGGTGGLGRGVAPAADLVFQAVEEYVDVSSNPLCGGLVDGYYLIGLPLDLEDLYSQAWGAGARIHSNSWGSDLAGQYTTDSANTDLFVFGHPTFVVTYSAGNAGVDTAPADGVVDSMSLGSPATAKNVIAVGASEGDRPDDFPCDTGLGYSSHDAYQSGTCSGQGGLNTLGTAGFRWGFTVPPLNTDVTAGNPEQMAPFSSRGPAEDGRIKPDVVAPGTWILSGYSGEYREGYGGSVNPANGLYQWDGWGIPHDADYKYMGGTSMSNPLVAGGAAVVADFYLKTDAHVASAALVKATLVNTARDLLDENNDGIDDNDFPIPNPHEGWGIVDLDNATDGTHRYVDNVVGLDTAATANFEFEVAAPGSPLRITLAWSDAPSTEAAAANLVNDLDLVVVAPDGTTTYAGNHFSAGWSQPGLIYDRVNNLENVYLADAAAGTWSVTVAAYNVPDGPQPFALVVDGDLASGGADTTPPEFTGVPGDITAEATGPAGAMVNYTPPTATDLVDGPVTVACLPASGTTFGLGTTTVTCTASDTAGNDATADFDVTVEDTPGVVRYGGADRYATAQAIASGDFPDPTAVDLVFVAYGGNFPDALAGAAIAGRVGSPLLLVANNSIPAATVSELERLAPATIVVLGGVGAISDDVATALGAYADEVIRIAGPDRYSTAVAVSQFGFPDEGSAEVVIVATGLGFADALAGGPAAVALGGPVLLTDPSSLPGVVAAEIERLAPPRILVIGGAAVVSETVFSQLTELSAEVERIAGSDRYLTAIAVSNVAFAGTVRAYLATGLNFPDALAGAAAAGWWGGPMLLVPGTALPTAVADEVTRLGASKAIILGGTGVVSQSVEDALAGILS